MFTFPFESRPLAISRTGTSGNRSAGFFRPGSLRIWVWTPLPQWTGSRRRMPWRMAWERSATKWPTVKHHKTVFQTIKAQQTQKLLTGASSNTDVKHLWMRMSSQRNPLHELWSNGKFVRYLWHRAQVWLDLPHGASSTISWCTRSRNFFYTPYLSFISFQ